MTKPTAAHTLGPHVVGQRVVVRRILPGETGPSGGPAMTDLLGVCESWDETRTTIRGEDGSLTTIALAEIVSGKPVPPRPSRFARLSTDEVSRRAAALFVPRETARVGDWVLRYSGGERARANSVLPLGDPGTDLDPALEQVAAFYASHDRIATIQTVVGSPLHQELDSRAWTYLRPEEGDAEVLLAGIAQLSRGLAGASGGSEPHHEPSLSREWLVGNASALKNYDAVEASLALPDATFLSFHDDRGQTARGRVNLVDDWAFVADLTVRPDVRRTGLARQVMAELTEWSAERGASVMLLQVLSENQPAQALYAGLGFASHHTYRYLTPAR